MKKLVALGLFGLLAACDPPLEHHFPAKLVALERDGRQYDVRVQFDPIDYAWHSEVATPLMDLAAEDRDAVVALVTQQVGALVCEEGQPMKLDDLWVWRLHNEDPVLYLAEAQKYRLVTRCT